MKANGTPVGALWLLVTATALSAERPEASTGAPTRARWVTSVSAGYLHHLQTGLKDTDGDFDVNRFISRVSVGYMPDYTKSVSLSVGYDRSAYGFSGLTGLPGGEPWDDINTFRIGAPVRWGLDPKWTLFVIPALRWNAEDEADWARALSGGGFAGFSYQISDSLTLGPGFGALTQLEGPPSYFPVIIVDWDITSSLKLETGRALGASQGPGLLLSYALSDAWSLSVGGRYERFRFRLSSEGSVPDGVGEDKGVPVYLGARYRWNQHGDVAVLGGVSFGGKLTLDDDAGDEVSSTSYDPAPFFGLTVDLRF